MVKFMWIYCEPQNSILIVISFDIILIMFRQLKSLKFVHEAYQLTLIILRSQPFAFFMFHDFYCCLIQESSSMPLNKTKNASLLLLSSCGSWSLWWCYIIQECHWQQIKIKWDAKQMKTKMVDGRRFNMQMQDMRRNQKLSTNQHCDINSNIIYFDNNFQGQCIKRSCFCEYFMDFTLPNLVPWHKLPIIEFVINWFVVHIVKVHLSV